MNKSISIFILLALLTTGVWAQVWSGAVDTEWYWDNTSQTEFTITTAEQLAGLAQLVNGGNSFSGKTIKLGTNIMLNDTANWRKWRDTKPTNTWTPVGSYTDKNNNRPFSGTFDGNGYVVSGVYIKNSNNYQGLFGYVSYGTTIKNLGIAASLVEGDSYVGGLVGRNESGTITNCHATGNVSGSRDYRSRGGGGLVGWNEGGTITNCYATGNVSGSYGSGGLVGRNEGGTITDCYATGNVNDYDAGGLVGSNSGNIGFCYATGNVSGSGYGGGVSGGLVGSNSGNIGVCYATGNVKGGRYSGGLVGENEGGITNCYSTGDVQSDNNVGGLVGNSKGIVVNCYAVGNVSGTTSSTIGGLVGTNAGGMINSYYDRQTSGQVDIDKGEPKSTTQMKQQATFVGWDFDKIWIINAGKNNEYPDLQLSQLSQLFQNEIITKQKKSHKIQQGKILTDKRDGKKYKTVIIGTQTWMAENLNYDDGKCYGNNSSNCQKYGRLYSWGAWACPSGWHLPSDEEWTRLTDYIGGLSTAGKKLKSKSGWDSDGTDEYGFTALPGGYGSDYFYDAGYNGYWWSATEKEEGNFMSNRYAYGRYINYSSASMIRDSYNKEDMHSVRCVQD
jgi:uncharacterized protein (TIGR02145 family)